MKKILSFLFLPFLCGVCHGESMSFVTVLSSPVGSFNKLETVDSQTSAKGKTVNFCTKVGAGGTVELKGKDNARLSLINIGHNAILGRTGTGKYSLKNITLALGGNLTGGQLFGKTLTVVESSVGKAENNVYGDTLTVAGARADKLTIGTGSNVESKITVASAESPSMVWSNEYQTDSACKDTDCAKQYLLKSGSGGTSGNCSNDGYRFAHKAECCPGMPTTDSICWTNHWGWSDKKIFTGTFTVKFDPGVAGTNCAQAAALGTASTTYVFPTGLFNSCGDNDSFTRFEQECNSTTGGIHSVCYYQPSISTFLSQSQRFGWVNCTSDGWTCTCTTSKWQGHECVAQPAQKNGW